jgi:hypothetical protein
MDLARAALCTKKHQVMSRAGEVTEIETASVADFESEL